ncbi:spore germination protein KC [Sporomusaceae bacterium BoRhaA]|uniref:Ger(x)C family spore germination protein n=1 Tax=Pelorhabdus rhamnosifermentans TaxID=2772457 RepID=UPI001C05F3DB|nr:Ger(x)C family spore germination protein [Pelorhabdus rhamnosifermentans]MBU2703757.1 spore germination protein KC [Pelorhabdus rhamnosifermentans]
MGLRFAAVICFTLMTIFISGCNGGRETDEVAYVIGIGIDKAGEGELNITYQIAIPKALGSGGGGSGESGDSAGSKSVETVTIHTNNIAEARNILNTLMARVPNLSHNKAFFIGEELARQGVGDIFGPLVRYREYRGSMFIAIVRGGTAQDYLKKLNPKLELLPSKFIETMMLTHNETGYYVRSNLQEFYKSMKSGSDSPHAALISTNSVDGQDLPSGEKLPYEKLNEYLAGDIPVYGSAAASNFAGTALFRHDKMVGTLTTEETRMLLILQGNLPRAFTVIEDPQLPDKAVNIQMRLGEKPTITLSSKDGYLVFDVSVMLEGEVTAIPSGIHYEQGKDKKQLEAELSAVIQNQIEKMLKKTQLMGSDPVGFGYYSRTLFPTYQAWQQQNWDEIYPSVQFHIHVTTKLRRTGLMGKTSPIKGK